MAVFICPLQVVKSLVKGRLLVTEDITIALSWASIVMAVVLVIPAFSSSFLLNITPNEFPIFFKLV
jgi:hypothetical protein